MLCVVPAARALSLFRPGQCPAASSGEPPPPPELHPAPLLLWHVVQVMAEMQTAKTRVEH